MIDAHFHIWQLARGDYGWLTPALGPIHRDVAPIDLARGWDAEALGRYTTWRRTFDYLPNWRYGAHEVEFTAPAPPPPSWTIDRVEPGD